MTLYIKKKNPQAIIPINKNIGQNCILTDSSPSFTSIPEIPILPLKSS